MADRGPRHSVSVSAVIVNDRGEFLVIRRRDNGAWEPPGGVLELEEGIVEGLTREVREETGLQVEPERLTGVYKNLPRGIVALVFRCRIVSGSPGPSDEVAEVRWLPAAMLDEHMTEAYAVRLLDAVDEAGVAVREHDGAVLNAPR